MTTAETSLSRRTLLAGSAAAAMTGVATATATARNERPIAFVGARVVDGNGGTPYENGVVIVRGVRVDAIGVKGDVAIPTDASIIDVAGMTIVPALIDAHTHAASSTERSLRPKTTVLQRLRST